MTGPCSAAGVFICLLEYPRGKRKKGSTMERWSVAPIWAGGGGQPFLGPLYLGGKEPGTLGGVGAVAGVLRQSGPNPVVCLSFHV